jgi:hypothetical protein
MVNKDKTITVGDLLKMLADGRVTPDMPLGAVVCDGSKGAVPVRGIIACELYNYKDGSKAVALYASDPCGDTKDVESASELFP